MDCAKDVLLHEVFELVATKNLAIRWFNAQRFFGKRDVSTNLSLQLHILQADFFVGIIDETIEMRGVVVSDFL